MKCVCHSEHTTLARFQAREAPAELIFISFLLFCLLTASNSWVPHCELRAALPGSGGKPMFINVGAIQAGLAISARGGGAARQGTCQLNSAADSGCVAHDTEWRRNIKQDGRLLKMINGTLWRTDKLNKINTYNQFTPDTCNLPTPSNLQKAPFLCVAGVSARCCWPARHFHKFLVLWCYLLI